MMRLTRVPTIEESEHWIGVAQASQILGVHPSTLRQWTTQGRLRAFLTPGGHRRYREADLRAFRAQPTRANLGRSLVAMILTAQPRCGLSGAAISSAYGWLSILDEPHRQRPRLLGGALVRLLARYLTADDDEAERCLRQACEDAAEYGTLAPDLGLSPAAAIEAFTVCRAPIVEAAQHWASTVQAGNHTRNTVDHTASAREREPHHLLARVYRFFDATLMSMVQTLEDGPNARRARPAAHTRQPRPSVQGRRATIRP
jgi:excisionase family DNA binding protein